MSRKNSNPNYAEHWRRTRNLMLTTLAVWFVFSFLVHWFGHLLNNFSLFGFPLGFYMAAQGSLIAFVLLLCWLVRAQNKLDHECNVDEMREKPPVEEENQGDASA